MKARSTRVLSLVMFSGLAISGGSALAQDSVSSSTGVGGDAISAYDTARQTVRYAVDLVPANSSWGNLWGIAPLIKTSRDDAPTFNTLALGAGAVSPDKRTGVGLAGIEQTFSTWATAGEGVGDTNAAPSTTNIPSFDHYFGVALGDLNAEASNAIGALVGFNDAEPNTLYVRRTIAAQSRSFSFLDDNGTVTAGAIDADGNVHLRADDFNGASTNQLLGQNIVSVDVANRSSGLNGLAGSGGMNIAGDAGASNYALDDGAVTVNSPAALPETLASGAGQPIILDFKGDYAVGSATPGNTHLDAGVDAHRGNPTFSAITPLGGVGTVGSLARTTVAADRTAGFNLFGLDASGVVTGTMSATLPSPMPGAPTLNAADDAAFDHYRNQTNFRGPSGHVALGTNALTGNALAAATATDPTAGDFIAVAEFGGTTTWKVAASVGSPVLNGPNGANIGNLAAGTIASLSAPALDLQGNVYFVGLFDDTINAVVPALFRAVNTAGGYQLELLLKQGTSFVGANSQTQYTVESIALADADSIASSGFSASSVLQQTEDTPTSPQDAFSVGAVIVGATVSYARVGGPEKYDTLIVLKPEKPVGSLCGADFDNDGDVDLTDFGTFGAAFGSMTGDANYNADADFDSDGDVDLTDFGSFGSEFGRTDC